MSNQPEFIDPTLLALQEAMGPFAAIAKSAADVRGLSKVLAKQVQGYLQALHVIVSPWLEWDDVTVAVGDKKMARVLSDSSIGVARWRCYVKLGANSLRVRAYDVPLLTMRLDDRTVKLLDDPMATLALPKTELDRVGASSVSDLWVGARPVRTETNSKGRLIDRGVSPIDYPPGLTDLRTLMTKAHTCNGSPWWPFTRFFWEAEVPQSFVSEHQLSKDVAMAFVDKAQEIVMPMLEELNRQQQKLNQAIEWHGTSLALPSPGQTTRGVE